MEPVQPPASWARCNHPGIYEVSVFIEARSVSLIPEDQLSVRWVDADGTCRVAIVPASLITEAAQKAADVRIHPNL